MLRAYVGEIFVHSPDKSGLPSAVRGAGAARSGLPSAARGIPAVGCDNHCAASGAVSISVTRAVRLALIFEAPADGRRFRQPWAFSDPASDRSCVPLTISALTSTRGCAARMLHIATLGRGKLSTIAPNLRHRGGRGAGL